MVRSHHMQRAWEGRVPASTLRIQDTGSAALPKPLHGWATPQEHSGAWSQRGILLPQGTAAHSHVVQQVGGCRSLTLCLLAGALGHLAPIRSLPFAPFPGSWPCRVPTILPPPGYLQNAALGDSLISQGAAFPRFLFLHNVRSLVGSTWAISGGSDRSITPL